MCRYIVIQAELCRLCIGLYLGEVTTSVQLPARPQVDDYSVVHVKQRSQKLASVAT